MSGSLSHSPAEVVRKLLVDLGLATAPTTPPGGWPAYVDHCPDVPARSLCVYNTESRLQGRRMVDGVVCEHYGLQVRVQSEPLAPEYAMNRARSIATVFAEQVLRNNVAIGSSTYLVQSIARTSGVLSLGMDTANRHRLFTINFLVSLRQLS